MRYPYYTITPRRLVVTYWVSPGVGSSYTRSYTSWSMEKEDRGEPYEDTIPDTCVLLLTGGTYEAR